MGRFLSATAEEAPTELFSQTQTSNTTLTIGSLMGATVGSQFSTSITSATLTEVINQSGSGYLTFAGLVTSSASNVTSPKLVVVIDGVTVYSDLSIPTMLDSQLLSLVGSFYVNSTNDRTSATEVKVRFNSSLVVSIAGDGTNGVQFAYKYYLT